MKKEIIEEKLKQTIEYHGKLLEEFTKLEKRLNNLKDQLQQTVGRAQTYQELLEEMKHQESVADKHKDEAL